MHFKNKPSQQIFTEVSYVCISEDDAVCVHHKKGERWTGSSLTEGERVSILCNQFPV